ncbi:MFS transporter [Psychrobacter sp. KH172YL61]|uniref:MFS transporter n=1 Tax=Psychrobacter sp. KH172YL61 TaxID=2517899 RepID=UPI0022B788CF|nr:MFS transporter [Psychrobacter sp. KH172YL61]
MNDAHKNSRDQRLSDEQVRRVLVTLLLGGTVISFSNSALNPAIPVFMSVFDVDIVLGGWVLNAYVLAMSVGLMLSGYLNKRFASKPVYLAAVLGFMLGSVMGMMAFNMSFVIMAEPYKG